MTVIPKNHYSEDMPKHIRYRPSACPRCGAKTEQEAAKLCTPYQDQTGDYECPGSETSVFLYGVQWDKREVACEPTVAEYKAEGKAFEEYITGPCDTDGIGCGKPRHACICTWDHENAKCVQPVEASA